MPSPRRLILLIGFGLLFLVAACMRGHGPGTRPGTGPGAGTTRPAAIASDPRFPDRWIAGVRCDTDPPLQVHEFDDGFVIIRQSKCVHYEAPFMYLLMGREKAVLFDTGSPGDPPLLDAVDTVLDAWKTRHGLDTLDLIVAHTHGHFDHIFNDGVFADRPDTTVVGRDVGSVTSFWGIEQWPEQTVSYDLGGRVIDIVPTPGHEPAHIAIYDRATRVLISGDTFYPGYLFVFAPADWPVFRDSTRRLLEFAESNPVDWLLGCHIEISRSGRSYAYGAGGHPDERPLQLQVSDLRRLDAALDAMGDEPKVESLQDFVIMPVWAADLF